MLHWDAPLPDIKDCCGGGGRWRCGWKWLLLLNSDGGKLLLLLSSGNGNNSRGGRLIRGRGEIRPRRLPGLVHRAAPRHRPRRRHCRRPWTRGAPGRRPRPPPKPCQLKQVSSHIIGQIGPSDQIDMPTTLCILQQIVAGRNSKQI